MKSTMWNSKKWKFPFFTIWSGQSVSLLGSRIAQFALVWWLTQLTGSATVLATGTLIALLPEIFVAPLAGAYIDRWNRRWVMVIADGVVAAGFSRARCPFLARCYAGLACLCGYAVSGAGK